MTLELPLLLPLPENERIPLSVIRGRAFCWSAEDAITLRVKYHIVGTFVGTLPGAQQQNIFLGLPLLLSACEAALLLDIEVARLVDDVKSHAQSSASEEQVQLWLEAESQRRSQSAQARPATIPKLSPADEEKRRMRQEARALRSANSGSGSPQTQSVTKKVSSAATSAVEVANIPCSSSSLPWYNPIFTIDRSILLPPPNQAIIGAFKHLHSQGYFLSPGIRFGCHFSVYPGDPLRYHSHFNCLALQQGEEVDMMTLIALGRLGSQVKKSSLLVGQCSLRKKTLTYSFEWAGFGT